MFVPKKLLFITAAAFATAAPAVSAASIIVEDSTPASLGGGVRGTRQQQQQQQQQQQPRLLQLNLDGPEWTSTGCPAQPVASGDDCTIPEPYLYQHCIYGPIECNCRRDDPIYVCQPYNFVLIPARPVPPSPTPPVPPPPVPVPTVGPTLGTTIPPIASPVPAAPTSSGGGSGTAPEFTGTTTEINGKSCPSDPDEANGTNCCQFLPRPEGGVGDEASCLYPTGTQCNCPGQLNEDGTSLCSIDGWVCRVILPPAPSSAPAASQTNPPAPTPAVAPYSAPVSIAQGFYAEGKLNFDMTLTGNTNVIGAHLHTGSANTNGPIAVIFCGVAPLPDMNGPCAVSNVNDENKERYLADWESKTVDPDVAFTSGVNNATAVANAALIADGAASSLEELGTELRACTDASTCNVYINIHTNYSFTQNPALGLARGQLQLITCPDGKAVKEDGYDSKNTKCFSASVTSANTNNVPVPNLLADDAGNVQPLTGDVLVVWYDDAQSTGTGAPIFSGVPAPFPATDAPISSVAPAPQTNPPAPTPAVATGAPILSGVPAPLPATDAPISSVAPAPQTDPAASPADGCGPNGAACGNLLQENQDTLMCSGISFTGEQTSQVQRDYNCICEKSQPFWVCTDTFTTPAPAPPSAAPPSANDGCPPDDSSPEGSSCAGFLGVGQLDGTCNFVRVIDGNIENLEAFKCTCTAGPAPVWECDGTFSPVSAPSLMPAGQTVPTSTMPNTSAPVAPSAPTAGPCATFAPTFPGDGTSCAGAVPVGLPNIVCTYRQEVTNSDGVETEESASCTCAKDNEIWSCDGTITPPPPTTAPVV